MSRALLVASELLLVHRGGPKPIATPPRRSPPGTIWKLTHTITTRQFWLRPDIEITKLFLFLLAVWSTRHQLSVHLATVLSNHLHMLITDDLGDRIQAFNRDFFSDLARAVNVTRKRKGNLLDPDGVNCVDVCPLADDLVYHGTYVANNAVDAGLVAKARKWPGVNFLPSDMGTLKIEIERPSWFFDPFGEYPDSAVLELRIPNALDCDPAELRERMIRDQKEKEAAKRQAMADAGKTVLGRKRILRQSVRSRPDHDPPLFERVPHIACKNSRLRVRMLEWLKDWRARYRDALRRVRNGAEGVVFPAGTWLQHFYCGRARAEYSDSVWVALMFDP